ncbi:U11/U12 small nuclear ribonucleoprotein 48 kDa protein-like isoform X1 [Sinocyclocheilus grahami]|uniref:U11/U12 small nuclear ribonucleoprotein 48 kDa protein-like isoform X1 n=1 Tax=Sinocyclocheilus grahami TaxID=75366 RepID=UPI0007ACD2B0|nr:PREDICTED: U11/U12 small nuclear ribonucleoprotein 48 kDa protein-like isoform X1 [Sinocyclocheilus grahami]
MCETSFSLGLQELTDFTESCQADLKGLFEALGWSQELDSHAFQMEVCPYDPNHTVPQDRMEKHKASCQLSKMGYSKEEQAEMFDPSVYYEKANIPSINTGDASTDLDIPQNHKRALCDLTVADRLALYDHVIQQASQQSAKRESNKDLYVDLVAKLKKDEEQSGPKSHLEVLAEMRDYRRRRQSYRAKNVHITKKSYTEVIREVIDIHSGELGRIWQEVKDEEFKASQQSSHRGASERGRSASVESRVSSREEHGHKRRRKHSRSHSRKRSRERKNKSSRVSHSPDVERHHKKKKS